MTIITLPRKNEESFEEGEKRNSSIGLSSKPARHGTRSMQDAHFIDERVSQRAFSSLPLPLQSTPLHPSLSLVPMHATDLSTCPRIIRRLGPNQLSPWPDYVSRATTVCLLLSLLLSTIPFVSTVPDFDTAGLTRRDCPRDNAQGGSGGASFDPGPRREERGASVKMLLPSGDRGRAH